MSASCVAVHLGIKKQNINLWIKGKQNIPKKYLPILEEIFHVDADYFTKELDEIEKLEIQKEKLKNMRDKQGVPENLNTILLIESHVHPYLTFLPKK
ncbi:hypothetical protein TEPIDINF_002674 [Tepidibacillus infernus]|uniref:hypothetical protein n=1 Tax=Tepidibacillus infernus TaxID=1806172 RepID=UPI003B6BFE9B